MEFGIDVSTLVHTVPAMVYTYTVNHETGENKFPFVSNYCEEMFGLSAATIVNDSESFVNLVHLDDVEGFASSVMHSMNTMTVWDHKMRMKTVEDKWLYIHGKSTPYRKDFLNEDGVYSQITEWHGVLFDITDDYQEEQTRSSRGQSLSQSVEESFQDTGPQPFEKLKADFFPCFIIDKDGIIQGWHNKMTILTDGVLESDSVGKSLRTLAPESESGRVQVEKFLSTATNKLSSLDDVDVDEYTDNIMLLSPHGRQVHLSVVCYPLQNPLQLLCICEDITPIKLAEREKEEALVLLNAEKQLSEWLSHEIRNPLTVALEAAKAIKENQVYSNPNAGYNMVCDSNYEKSASYVDLIINSICYVIDLLSNVLDVNKLAAGKLVLRPSVCKLKEDVIQPVQEMMSIKKGEKVPILYIGQNVDVFLDRLRLQQVITNLVSNSIKFTKKGQITINSQIANQDINGNAIPQSLLISISDTGVGIPEKNRLKLFSKWEQLHGNDENGTGIGLCFCKLLISAMNGTIYLNEQYNSGIEGFPGAQFVVQLPFDDIAVKRDGDCSVSSKNKIENQKMPAYTTLSHAVKAKNKSKSSGSLKVQHLLRISNSAYIKGCFKLLIVDDDKIVRNLIRRRIARIFPDALCHEASTGEETLEIFLGQNRKTRRPYDIVLIDHYMGDGLTGEQTIRKLRNKNVDSIIIGLSGNDMEADHKAAGAEAFFRKPLPSQNEILKQLVPIMSLPTEWKVLIVGDSQVLERKLERINANQYTSPEETNNTWSITTTQNINKAINHIKAESLDLVIVDEQLNEDCVVMEGTDLITIARLQGLNKNAIIILNNCTACNSLESPHMFDLMWEKPIPSAYLMKQSICGALLFNVV